MAYQKNPVFEYFGDSDRITCEASADLLGKTFVKLVAGGRDQRPKVTTCAAGDRPYGVAGWDAKAGEAVTVYRRGVVSVTAGAAITAGAGVVSGASGKAAVTSTPGADFGQAHADAASGADVAVALSI